MGQLRVSSERCRFLALQLFAILEIEYVAYFVVETCHFSLILNN